jgi:hypothetical protein
MPQPTQTAKDIVIARLRGAIVAVEHGDSRAAEELVTGVREALMRGLELDTARLQAETRALDLGEAMDADTVECDGRPLVIRRGPPK